MSLKRTKIGKNKQFEIYSFLRFLYPKKEKQIFFFHRYYENNIVLYLLFQNIITLTIINWLSQGLQGMSKSEAFFHLFFEAIFLLLLFLGFDFSFHISLIIAHTINWFFNSHFWTFFRFYNIRYNRAENYYKYLESLKIRLKNTKCFSEVYLIGSPARDKKLSDFSDLDVKYVLKNGFYNLIHGNILLIIERIRTTFLRIPFDGNIYSVKKLGAIDEREVAIPLIHEK